jgi:hypothetical protein
MMAPITTNFILNKLYHDASVVARNLQSIRSPIANPLLIEKNYRRMQ